MIALEWSVTVVSISPELFEDIHGDDAVLKYLDMMHERFIQGERDGILGALVVCAEYQAVIPDWVTDELLSLDSKINSGKVTDYNEFFGFNKVKVPTQRHEYLIGKHEKKVYGALFEARLNNKGFGVDLFDEIAAETGVSRRIVEAIYKKNKASLQGLPRSKPENTIYGFIHTNIPLNDGRRYGRGVLKDKD